MTEKITKEIREHMISRIVDDMMNTISSGETGWLDDLLRNGHEGLNAMSDEQLVAYYNGAGLDDDGE